MNQVDFYYEGGKAGRFDVSCFPSTSGEVTYEPYRSRSHHAMGMAIDDSGFAECYYEARGRRVHFRVTAVPVYGRLQVENIVT